MIDDIHETARSWFAAKVANGSTPSRVQGGQLDGLQFFEVEIDSQRIWLTETGALTLPVEDSDE